MATAGDKNRVIGSDESMSQVNRVKLLLGGRDLVDNNDEEVEESYDDE
jgi:hypothetical protein